MGVCLEPRRGERTTSRRRPKATVDAPAQLDCAMRAALLANRGGVAPRAQGHGRFTTTYAIIATATFPCMAMGPDVNSAELTCASVMIMAYPRASFKPAQLQLQRTCMRQYSSVT